VTTGVTEDELRARADGWTPPSHLGIPTPRPVTFTSSGWLAVLGAPALIVAILVGMVVMWRSLDRTRDHSAALRRDGIRAQARVISEWASGSKRRTYHLTYVFNADKKGYARTASVTQRFYSSHLTLVPIRYARENPLDNVLVDGERVSNPAVAFFLLVPVAALLVFPALALQERALLRNGSIVPALVREHTPHKSRVLVNYAFLNARGRIVRAGYFTDKDQVPAIGTVVPVLAGPRFGAPNEPYPLFYARLVDTAMRGTPQALS
jgi:hypothetical protein